MGSHLWYKTFGRLDEHFAAGHGYPAGFAVRHYELAELLVSNLLHLHLHLHLLPHQPPAQVLPHLKSDHNLKSFLVAAVVFVVVNMIILFVQQPQEIQVSRLLL